jgi:hypothetical protein
MRQPVIYGRLEGAIILLASLAFYLHLHFSFIWFVVLLFAFDISMVGYLINTRIGAHIYNLVHSLIAPPLWLLLGAITSNHLAIGLGLIWLSHIGLDRALGYGLKFPGSFSETHLGHIGKGKQASRNSYKRSNPGQSPGQG